MTTRPSDEDHAAAAARHIFEKPAAERDSRLEELRPQGVRDEATLRSHALAVMTAPDTQSFRGAHGRESYANDRMNTIVHTWENNKEANSLYYNSERDTGGRSASARLEVMADRERTEYSQAKCEIRLGGSRALEQDRVEQCRREEAERRPSFPPPLPPQPPAPAPDEIRARERGR